MQKYSNGNFHIYFVQKQTTFDTRDPASNVRLIKGEDFDRAVNKKMFSWVVENPGWL